MCLIELLPAVLVCITGPLNETEGNDLQILTVAYSSHELNARNRGESYKDCCTSLMHS